MQITTDSGIVFNIPESLNDIKINQVYDFFVDEEKLNSDQAEIHLFGSLTHIYGEDVSDLPIGNIGDKFSIGQELTAFGLYSYTVSLINEYKPEIKDDYSIMFKGERFEISATTKDSALGQRGLTVGEMITGMTFKHYASKRDSKSFDNIDFNLTLEQIAVLLRKPDEKLPIDITKRTEFINQRKYLFSELPYSVALDIVFFLIRPDLK